MCLVKDGPAPPLLTLILVGTGGRGTTANAPRGAKENSVKYIFTKKFFDSSAIDQSGIVDAAVRELDQCWTNQADEGESDGHGNGSKRRRSNTAY